MSLIVVFLLAFVVPSSYSQFYTSFDPHGEGFTQELYGHAPITSNFFMGIAFIGNQILATNTGGRDVWLFSATADTPEEGTMVHTPTHKQFPYPVGNVINHPDGFLYFAAFNRGIVKIDPVTLEEVPINGQLGGQTNPKTAHLGMAVYPKDHTKIYFSTHGPEGIAVLDTTTNQVSMFKEGIDLTDGVYFNTAGDLLYLAHITNQVVAVIEVPSGVVKARVSIPYPDGIAFHDCTNSAFVANNNGELWRIDGTTFTAELFASGAFRGDLGAVGPDGCFYVTYSEGFRYPNGVTDFSHSSSIVKICNDQCGFSTPPGVPKGGIACGDGTTNAQPFGFVSSLFNVLVFEDFSCKYSDTEGRLAAGGKIDLEGYSVGCRVFAEPDQNCIHFGEVTCADINAADAWADSVVSGTTINWAHGEVKAGNLAYGTTKALSNVNIVSDCAVHQSSPIDFANEKTLLQRVSHNVKSAVVTGTIVDRYGSLIFQGTGADVEVFSVTAAQIGSAQGIKFEDVKPTGTVLINVSGKIVTAGSFGFFNVKAERILWNFWEATSLTLQNIQWEGSVLAIFADVKEPTGQINGQVFANSWKGSSTGTCMQQNHVPFKGCVPSDEYGGLPPPPPPVCQDVCVQTLFGATYYNAFIRNQFECKNSDVEGRLAAGTTINVQSMGFANCISLDPTSEEPCKTYNSCSDLPDHVETVYSGGQIYSTGPVGVAVGDVIHNGIGAGTIFANGQGCRVTTEPKGVDLIHFSDEFSKLMEMSDNLCTLADTGSVNGFAFKGDGTLDREVFSLSASNIQNVQAQLLTVKSGATIVINVRDDQASFQSVNLDAFPARKTLWNFCNAISISVKQIGWKGSILAPRATFTDPQGQIDGQVIADTWHGLNPNDPDFACMELHEKPFNGCLPSCF